MKKILPLLTITLSSMLLSGCIIVNAKSAIHESTENLSLNSKGLSELKIDAGAGFIVVEGDEGINTIEVTAEILSFDKDYQLSLTEKNGSAVLIAELNPNNTSKWFVFNTSSSDSAKIDLTIKIPKGLNLSIDDGSGNIDVNNIKGNIIIDDGSGNINLKNIQGTVNIEDGSGEIILVNISNAIDIDDGSGNIVIHHAASKVIVEDGSGEIELIDIAGTVEIDDGSGDLVVKSVKGHVTINDGSGDIKVTELASGLTITNAGSGGLSMSEVKGDIITN